jgi:ankyrin repeat protein
MINLLLHQNDDIDLRRRVHISSEFRTWTQGFQKRVKNYVQEEMMLPLHATARGGHKRALELILDHAEQNGDDITNTFARGKTALDFAAEYGHVDCLKILLDRTYLRITGEFTPIQMACLNGHTECVRVLLQDEYFCQREVQVSQYKYSALQCTAYGGHVDCMQILLLNDDIISACTVPRCDCYESPIHLACLKGNLECLEILLSFSVVWIWLYHTSCIHNHFLPIHLAAYGGHKACIECLLNKDPLMINMVDKDKKTALYYACLFGHDACTELLLHKGADCTIPDKEGKTALYDAAWKGHERCVALLLQNGADVHSALDIKGVSAMILAARNGNTECLKLLLEESSTDNKDELNELLLEASKFGHSSCVRLLLEYHVDVNASVRDYDSGASPLLLAVKKNPGVSSIPSGGYRDFNWLERDIYFALDHAIGSSGDYQYEFDRSILFRKASSDDFDDCIRILLINGAHPDQADHNGNTPMSVAQKDESGHILHILQNPGL